MSIITVTGLCGSGKSSIAKAIAKTLNYDFFSAGALVRNTAENLNMSIEAFSKQCSATIDQLIDQAGIRFAASHKHGVMDARIAHFFLEHDFIALFIDCSVETRAKRRAAELQRSYATVKKHIELRDSNDRLRLKNLYGKDFGDTGLCDAVFSNEGLRGDAEKMVLEYLTRRRIVPRQIVQHVS